ncbi:MAG: hypothetical protein IPI73_00745 [Betaproteobacteria bacterium]|nr:hypothetical protein [Betaproteobacteria bacterium]
MATTLVTGFIDLGAREARPPGKALDDYVRHARWLLAAGAPLVVFAEPHALAQLLPLRRAGAPTRWIAIDFASLRWHPALPRIAAAAAGPASSWLNPAKDTPGYLAVTYGKTEWLGRAARENPFGTAAFAWVDLGIAGLATDVGRVALSELDAGLADLSAATVCAGALRACAIEAVPADAFSRREVYYGGRVGRLRAACWPAAAPISHGSPGPSPPRSARAWTRASQAPRKWCGVRCCIAIRSASRAATGPTARALPTSRCRARTFT